MRILNLGAGVQSTCLFLMSHYAAIETVDYAIFADTQEEPDAVYAHLEWLQTVPAPAPIIIIGTKTKLGDDLVRAENSRGGRFVSIPCFTAKHHSLRAQREACSEGIVQRQCTKEYKVEVIDRIIRRQLLGLSPRQHVPKGTRIQQLFGISFDERSRAKRIRARMEAQPWSEPVFPLIEKQMTRDDCKDYLRDKVPHTTPRSACVFCPYKNAAEWLTTKANPKEWARAVEIDRALRDPSVAFNRKLDQSLYLHRQCIPLEMVDLETQAAKERDKKATPLFAMLDCGEGMCGV